MNFDAAAVNKQAKETPVRVNEIFLFTVMIPIHWNCAATAAKYGLWRNYAATLSIWKNLAFLSFPGGASRREA
jgi:hypothetical protein